MHGKQTHMSAYTLRSVGEIDGASEFEENGSRQEIVASGVLRVMY